MDELNINRKTITQVEPDEEIIEQLVEDES